VLPYTHFELSMCLSVYAVTCPNEMKQKVDLHLGSDLFVSKDGIGRLINAINPSDG